MLRVHRRWRNMHKQLHNAHTSLANTKCLTAHILLLSVIRWPTFSYSRLGWVRTTEHLQQFPAGQVLFLSSKQQRQNTEGNSKHPRQKSLTGPLQAIQSQENVRE